MMRHALATVVLGLILGLLTWEFIALVLSSLAFLFGLVALYKSAHAVSLVSQNLDLQSERIDMLKQRLDQGV